MTSRGMKVFVIGCGIAGPILAIFLKRKGFDPEVFERLDSVTDSGLSLLLQPNGCKVLSIFDDLHIIENLPGKWCERMAHYSQLDEEVLAEKDSPSTLAQFFHYGMIGVRRTDFQRLLVEKATEQGIPIHWGHQLISLVQNENAVTVTFKNGKSRTASFIVGCDGLHSNTRTCLFGREKPTFTGLVQTGGISPTPEALKEKATIAEFFGVQAHMITYPISDTHSSWAISTPEEEAKESWHSLDSQEKERIRNGTFSEWKFGAGELVKNLQKVIKYGLYDRPELKTWYKDRVVLLGDAAHPTTPHLGQGANQALEDIYHLVRVLLVAIPDRDTNESPSTATLTKAFAEYESIRIPRTATLVRGARANGERRVTMDVESSRKRDDQIKAEFGGIGLDPKRLTAYEFIFGAPFKDKSEI